MNNNSKRAWLKRSCFHLVEEVTCPDAAKSMASKASPMKRRASESTAKRQSVNPQTVQIRQARVVLV